MNTIDNRSADNLRILIASMVEKAKSGHPGGAMGGADFIHILYSEFLRFDPTDPAWFLRDRFFLDPGHMSPMLYSILTMFDFYKLDDLKQFRQWQSVTPGHPEVDVKRGVENTSGPLGQGHTMAVGAAIAERFIAQRFGEWSAHKTYAYISDGGVQEEISQGAGRIAGHLGLTNLIMFYDANDIQLSTSTNAVTSEDTAKKYESWGWKVLTINGNDHNQIRDALKQAVAETEKPFLIIGKTLMGKGILKESGESFEGQCATHGMPVGESGGSFPKTIENLGGNPAEPFTIFADVAEHYQKVKAQKVAEAQARKAKQAGWEKQNADLAAKLNQFISGKLPELNFDSIEHKPNLATRASSSNVLAFLAKNVDNMIVASADLSNSDKTDGFLKNTKAFSKGDFSGKFLQSGVAELTMAVIANGLALHGGVIPVCATFFVFSDYMKPAVRLAALMSLQVIYVWTHDAFRVGEDGPTHQPVEQEAQIRLMEQLKNHHGKNSMLVLRPCDSAETTVAWRMALENKDTPTGLILSRQNITDIPAKPNSTRKADAQQAEKGAYVVYQAAEYANIILLANGSEVATLYASISELESNGCKVRLVSAISEGLFRSQSEEYRKSVIDETPIFALTSGLPSTLKGLAGDNGRVWGLDHFGYSAPYNILDEKFGFAPQNIVNEVLEYIYEVELPY